MRTITASHMQSYMFCTGIICFTRSTRSRLTRKSQEELFVCKPAGKSALQLTKYSKWGRKLYMYVLFEFRGYNGMLSEYEFIFIRIRLLRFSHSYLIIIKPWGGANLVRALLFFVQPTINMITFLLVYNWGL